MSEEEALKYFNRGWEESKIASEELINALAKEIERIRAEKDKLRRALKPFADVARNDICASMADENIFRPMTQEFSRATMLKVGDLRATEVALKETE